MTKLLAALAIFGTLIIAGAHPGPAQSRPQAIQRTVALLGMAKEYDGTPCFHDCTIFAEDWINGTQRVWAVNGVAWTYLISCTGSGCIYTCQGHTYDWGLLVPPDAQFCGPKFEPGDSRWEEALWTGSVIKTWVRHACVGGSGFYFAPLHSHTLSQYENHNIDMGVQQLASPGSGCQI